MSGRLLLVAFKGDILVRCRHVSSKGARVSMFRAAFHTGYVPCGVLRLNKAQLDGPCTDDRFDDDFFIDLMFAPVSRCHQVPKGLDDGCRPGSSFPQLLTHPTYPFFL